jgi:ankyrin repeat protein
MTFDEAAHFIKKRDIVALRHALDEGLDPNLTHRFSSTLLMNAAWRGGTPIGRRLIERGANLDTKENRGESALSLAVMMGHTEFVRLLLDSGASPVCYPPQGSLESFLAWCEECCGTTREQIKNIRAIFNQTQLPRP